MPYKPRPKNASFFSHQLQSGVRGVQLVRMRSLFVYFYILHELANFFVGI
jgi:hypothetical protein